MANITERLPYDDASHPILYGLAHFAVGQFLNYKYDLQIHGSQYLRHDDPRVYVPTHTEATDPAVLGVSAEGRAIPTMAKDELWTDERYKKVGIQLGKILAVVDAFPVKRGSNDSKSYRLADAHIKSGRSVGLFAQGTRNFDFDNLYYGAPRLAYRNNVPIQPLTIATYGSNTGEPAHGLIRVIAARPLLPDITLPRDIAVEVLMGQLRETFKRDYGRAVGWAAFDATQNENRIKRIGRIKRHA